MTLKTALSNVLSSGLAKPLHSISTPQTPEALTRYFTDFVTGSTQYVNVPTVTMIDNYTLTLNFYIRDIDNYMLLGNSVEGADMYLFLTSAGVLRWRIGGVSVDSSVLDWTDLNQVNNLVISKVGTTVTMTLNGSVVGSGTQATNPAINQIAYYGGNLFPFNGLIWDVDLNGQAIYALDESGATAVDSVAANNGTYINSPLQTAFTQSITATTTAWRGDDNILTLFISDIRTHHELIHLGDSLTTRMLQETGNLDEYTSYYDRVHNRRVTAFNHGIGGNTITQMLARVPAIRTTFNGRSNVLAVVCGGVNDYYAYGEDYATALPANLATMEADLRSIISNFELDLHDVAVTSIPYIGTANIIADESQGTLPWTTNINNVVISEDNAAWYSGGAPILDAYVKTKANHPDWYDIDNIHYTPAGEKAFREWFADTIGPVLIL